MSEIDKTTNDFPKEWHTRQNGEIEKTNCDNDIYIVCKNNCKILNYGKGKLIFYCPSIKRFNNITKEINTKDKSIIIEQRISDKEGWFYFKAENIEKITVAKARQVIMTNFEDKDNYFDDAVKDIKEYEEASPTILEITDENTISKFVDEINEKGSTDEFCAELTEKE